jgi:CBS domain containing-hemolysin-like protein
METYLFVIIFSLLLSAFFSGSEIAFISANKLQIELEVKRKTLSTRALDRFIAQPSHFINNEGTILVLQTIVSTVIVLMTAEFLPKSLFLINPNWMLKAIAIPMRLFYFIIYPIVLLIVGLSKFIISNVLGMEYEENKAVFKLTDLNNFIKYYQKDSSSSALEVDTKILDNALEFKSLQVRECMIPRTDILAIDQTDSIDDLRKAFIESGYSKVLVYKESIDNVVGYCHSQAMFKKPEKIADIVTDILFVPETMLANELLFKFIDERRSLALVVDEFGGTSGLVTMEDVMEEIFGEIRDEHDDEDLIEQKVSINTYLLSARHEIDYLNEKYGWSLPVGEYETLGGLVLSITEDLPSKNQKVRVENYEIKVESVHNNRIETVAFTIRK